VPIIDVDPVQRSSFIKSCLSKKKRFECVGKKGDPDYSVMVGIS